MGLSAGAVLAIVLMCVAAAPVVGAKTFYVQSGSMRPTIPVGSLAVYTPVESGALGVGDVIAFRRPGGTGELVTHRIVRIVHGPSGKELVTKGDANAAADPWRVPAVGRGWRYRFAVPYLGYAIGVAGSGPVRLALLAAAVCAVGIVALRKVWRPTARVARA